MMPNSLARVRADLSLVRAEELMMQKSLDLHVTVENANREITVLFGHLADYFQGRLRFRLFVQQ